MGERTKFVLAIDGGGTRGSFAAGVVAEIERAFELSAAEKFGFFTGTSTGAIVAAALALRHTGAQIRDWYEKKEKLVFGRRKAKGIMIPGSIWSRYRTNALDKALQEKFGETKLGEVEKPLMIPATELRTGKVHMFKSQYDPGFTRDKDVALWEAVRASCSAPTYFDPHSGQSTGGAELFADGGMWCNNPGLAAVVDCEYRLGWRREEMRILTLGTGTQRVQYEPPKIGWGFLTGWGRTKVAGLCLSLQGEAAHNTLCLSMGQSPMPGQEERVFRIDWETDSNLKPDSQGGGDNMRAKAKRAVTHNSEGLRKFLEEGA